MDQSFCCLARWSTNIKSSESLLSPRPGASVLDIYHICPVSMILSRTELYLLCLSSYYLLFRSVFFPVFNLSSSVYEYDAPLGHDSMQSHRRTDDSGKQATSIFIIDLHARKAGFPKHRRTSTGTRGFTSQTTAISQPPPQETELSLFLFSFSSIYLIFSQFFLSLSPCCLLSSFCPKDSNEVLNYFQSKVEKAYKRDTLRCVTSLSYTYNQILMFRISRTCS